LSPESVTSNPLVRPIYNIVYNKYYFDEIYYYLFVKGVGFGLGKVSAFIDRFVIDGVVNGLAALSRACGDALRFTQSGLVNTYALYFVLGLLATVIIIWLV
jgi:NADH-quinone oxidoreductase subunit L